MIRGGHDACNRNEVPYGKVQEAVCSPLSRKIRDLQEYRFGSRIGNIFVCMVFLQER
jgi:hypothetical protein